MTYIFRSCFKETKQTKVFTIYYILPLGPCSSYLIIVNVYQKQLHEFDL